MSPETTVSGLELCMCVFECLVSEVTQRRVSFKEGMHLISVYHFPKVHLV